MLAHAHKHSHTVQHHSQDRHKSTLGEEGRQWSKTERVDREKKNWREKDGNRIRKQGEGDANKRDGEI